MERTAADELSSQHFNNAIVQYRVHSERDRFVSKLRERKSEILRLVASSCQRPVKGFFCPLGKNDYCTRGSYNLCFFVQFRDNDKCVLRIPLRPCLASCPAIKVNSEVATMQLLLERTTIPIPRVFSSRSEIHPDPLSTFIIMEYIDANVLSPIQLMDLEDDQKKELYKSLANIYIQLRRQEFPAIGRLHQTTEGIHSLGKTASVDINIQQLEGLEPFSIQEQFGAASGGSMRSANDYASMLLRIGFNAFLKSQNAVGEDMARSYIYHQHIFYQHIKSWMNQTLDKGPFVLVHGDLSPQNVMVDKNMKVVAVLDWEWSRVIPVQFFQPPLWLSGRDTVQLAGPDSWKIFRRATFRHFLAALREQELAMWNNTTLHDEWTASMEDAGPLFANALESWTDADWLAYRRLSHGKKSLDALVEKFIDDDPMRQAIAHVKELDGAAYRNELRSLKEKVQRPNSV